ncbi:MAG TPA: sugar kinase [Jatrophihabitans sp.]|nr:sugar kinase [Jatrophihabitans sp.]
MTVVCLGETMALVAPDPPRPLAEAHGLRLAHAGAESNVAIGLAALGTPVQWCSRLGDDALGRRIAADVAAAGVGTGLVRFVATAPTGLMLKDPEPGRTQVLYYRAGSAASTMDASDADRALDLRPELVHVTGVTPALSPSCAAVVDRVLDRAAADGVPVSLDVNLRPQLWPDLGTAAATLRRLAQRATVVFVGLDEAAALWGCTGADDVRACLDAPPVLVVKDGAGPATAFTGAGGTAVPALGVPVVEPVGAGDAFAAGFLHAWLARRPLVAALRLGHLMAAEVLASSTDQAVLLDPAALTAACDPAAPWPVPRPVPAREP